MTPTRIIVHACIAVATAASLGAQSPRPPATAGPVTITGCLQRDSAYRPTRPVAGANTEFLLVSSRPGTAAPAERDRFGLVGTVEPQLGRLVGRRVTVVGTLDTEPRDQQQPTGGVTDPVTGAGSAARRLTIISFKPADGGCTS